MFLLQRLAGVSAAVPRFARGVHCYQPRFNVVRKQHKGRVPVRIGGLTKGLDVDFGSYGLRLKLVGVRLAAIQLKEADECITKILRGTGGQLFRKMCTNIAVCTKGNETRMGKGKGPFDYWAVRVPTGKVVFEIGGSVHETIARDALRRAGDKLPGVYEFVRKGDPVRVGINGFRSADEATPVVAPSTKRARIEANIAASKLPEVLRYRGH